MPRTVASQLVFKKLDQLPHLLLDLSVVVLRNLIEIVKPTSYQLHLSNIDVTHGVLLDLRHIPCVHQVPARPATPTDEADRRNRSA